MVSPAPGARITSGFGPRISPITGKASTHNGVDFAVPVGTRLVAPTGGVVQFAGVLPNEPNSGVALGVKADDGRTSWSFSHLSAPLVAVGQRVTQGKPVALSGNTGASTGPHLHFVVRVDGKSVDPMRFIGAGAGGGLVKLAAVVGVGLALKGAMG